MKTKTILAMLAIGFISCALFSEQAQAIPITGDLGFSGATTFNTTSLTTATRVNSWFAFVGTTTGSFVGVPIGSVVTLAASWIFNPSTPTPGLWSVGGFSFDLDTATLIMLGSVAALFALQPSASQRAEQLTTNIAR
ncbi:MAG: hypothetical protein E6L07_10320 [Verrucomicrobia bacterium]|nr:MAG: hypothetical protein E6L07_10320 [Verrucomicrobiota bacterium]